MKLVVGLGNPGTDYAQTRHNVGFEITDQLCHRWGDGSWNKKFKGLLSSAQIAHERVMLLKPQTFMNLSGDSVQAVCAFYRIEPADIVVIHDDIDFALGRIAIKVGGGHGGHNGLRSIIGHLGRDFVRMRLGVGRPQYGDASHHVLSTFSPAEREIVDDMLKRAGDAVATFVREGYRAAQNRFNAWTPPKPENAPDEETKN